ncbi:hypothetical protein [Labilithrix luteola]|nr:hypothetical protein [Labilithrix luteola]
MFRTRITFEENGILLDDERVPFATIDDANVEDGVLVLSMASGQRRIKLKKDEAMTVLDGVLDGVERAHPHATPYRQPEHVVEASPAPHHPRRIHRPRVSAGSPDLMIGRTFSAG